MAKKQSWICSMLSITTDYQRLTKPSIFARFASERAVVRFRGAKNRAYSIYFNDIFGSSTRWRVMVDTPSERGDGAETAYPYHPRRWYKWAVWKSIVSTLRMCVQRVPPYTRCRRLMTKPTSLINKGKILIINSWEILYAHTCYHCRYNHFDVQFVNTLYITS